MSLFGSTEVPRVLAPQRRWVAFFPNSAFFAHRTRLVAHGWLSWWLWVSAQRLEPGELAVCSAVQIMFSPWAVITASRHESLP